MNLSVSSWQPSKCAVISNPSYLLRNSFQIESKCNVGSEYPVAIMRQFCARGKSLFQITKLFPIDTFKHCNSTFVAHCEPDSHFSGPESGSNDNTGNAETSNGAESEESKNSDSGPGEISTELKPKARKGRKKKTEETSDAEDGETPKPKARRGRKKKTDLNNDATEPAVSKLEPALINDERDLKNDTQPEKELFTASKITEEFLRDDVDASSEMVPLNKWTLTVAQVELVMIHARNRDPESAEMALRDMEFAGLEPGPRVFHGLAMAYILKGDIFGASDVLQRLLSRQLLPEHSTLVAIIAACGDHKLVPMGESILGLMEELEMGPRVAWCTLIEHLFKAGDTASANSMYLKGMRGGVASPYVASGDLNLLLLEGNAARGDLATCRDIVEAMQDRGQRPINQHFNLLLKAQCVLGQYPLMVNMHDKMYHAEVDGLQAERDAMKPNVDTYNIMLQAFAKETKFFGNDFADFMNCMVDSYRRVQPNTLTFALLTQICVRSLDHWKVGMTYFRAMVRDPSWLQLYASLESAPGSHPLQLLLRLLTMIRHIDELAMVLEEMVAQGVPMPAGSLRVDPKSRRTFVTSWMEPMGTEPDYGGPVDFIQRWNEEKGPDAVPSGYPVWVSRERDFEGFWEHGALGQLPHKSYKTVLLESWEDFFRRAYYLFLVDPSSQEPLFMELPNAKLVALFHSAFDIADALRAQDVQGARQLAFLPLGRDVYRPASLMLVSELRTELSGYGLKMEGKRPDLIDRVSRVRDASAAGLVDDQGTTQELVPGGDLQETLSLLSKLSLRKMYMGIHEGYQELMNSDLPSVRELWELFDREWETAKEEMGGEVEGDLGTLLGQYEGEGADLGGKEYSNDEEMDELFDEAAQFEKKLLMLTNKRDLKGLKNILEWEKQMKETYGRPFLFGLDESRPLKEQIGLDLGDEDVDVVTAWRMTWEEEHRAKMPKLYNAHDELELALRVYNAVRNLGLKPTPADTVFLIRRAMSMNYCSLLVPLVEAAEEMNHSLHPNLCTDIVLATYLNVSSEQGKWLANFLESSGMVEAGVLPNEDSPLVRHNEISSLHVASQRQAEANTDQQF